MIEIVKKFMGSWNAQENKVLTSSPFNGSPLPPSTTENIGDTYRISRSGFYNGEGWVAGYEIRSTGKGWTSLGKFKDEDGNEYIFVDERDKSESDSTTTEEHKPIGVKVFSSMSDMDNEVHRPNDIHCALSKRLKGENIPSNLISLEMHTKLSFEAYNERMRTGDTMVKNGIACPNCGDELRDIDPDILLTTCPPKLQIKCVNQKCGYDGYRFK